MYMILDYIKDDFVTAIVNVRGNVKLFESIEEADDFANKHEDTDNLKVISIECVHE